MHKFLSSFGIFIAIVVLALSLRAYKLGSVPHGMTWDEAAVGYNGYAVITKRRDEWLSRLPVSFKSFGDYKAPLAIYLTGGFVWLLGSELWIVRLPFMLAGVGSVVGFMILLERITQQNVLNKKWLIATGGLLLAISPWHLHFSRIGFESGLALFFLIWGLIGLYQVLADHKQKWLVWLWALVTTVPLVAALYTYHSAKVAVPVLVAAVIVLNWKSALKKWLVIAVIAALSLGLLRPMIKDSLEGPGNERFKQTSLIGRDISTPEKISLVGQNFLLHFKPSFLVGGQTDTTRHGDGIHGVLWLPTFVLVLVGLGSFSYMLISPAKKGEESEWRETLLRLSSLGIVWIAAGILPAAIGTDVPHSNRALLALPGFLLLATSGWMWLVRVVSNSEMNQQSWGTHHEKGMPVKAMIGSVVLIYAALLFQYQQSYYSHFAKISAEDFKDGYLEAFEFVVPYEKGTNGHTKVDQVVFTSEYGQPYIYALFVRRTDPIWYQGGSLNNYLFTDKISSSDLERPNTIVVASGRDDLPLEQADKVVYGSDGSIKFKIYVNQ